MKAAHSILRVFALSAICSTPVLAAGLQQFEPIEPQPDDRIEVRRGRGPRTRMHSFSRSPSLVLDGPSHGPLSLAVPLP